MAVFTIRGPAKKKTDFTPRHGGVRWRTAAGAATMAVAVALTGCAVPAEGPRLVPIAATPASVDPAKIEEHTSELQSPTHLVCRLLLEKKNL